MIITNRVFSCAALVFALLSAPVLAQSGGNAGALRLAQAELTHGPVQARETLWSIARRYAPDDASVSRMSVSIFRANPSAFTDNNINLLKRGVMLKIPAAAAAISAIDGKEAVEVLQTHNASMQQPETPISQSVPAGKAAAPVADPNASPTGNAITATATLEPAMGVMQTDMVEAPDSTEMPESKPAMQMAVASDTPATPPESGAAPPPAHDDHDHHDEIVTRLSYDVSAMHDDNIRRSTYADDIRDDYMINLTLNGKLLFAVSEYSNMTLAARLGLEKFSTFNQLDSLLYEGSVKYAFAFSSAFSAPTYAIKLQIGTQDFESEMRDADFAILGFEASSQLTDRLFLIGGVKSKQRESRSRVFDTREDQLFVNTDLSLSRRSLMYLTYHYIVGDLVSTATPRLVFINAAEIIEPDDAYGGRAFNQFAYRLDATTQVVTLGFNYAVKRGMTFDFSVRYANSEADDSNRIEYDRTIVRAGFIGRF